MSKDKGDIGELAFALRSRRAGLRINSPMDHNSPYDAIVDNGQRLYKIQVKTTSNNITTRGKTMHCAYKVNLSRGSSCKKAYKPGEVDFYAVYIYPEDLFYIIPFSAITSVSTNLYTNKQDHKFSKYLENFDLLK